MTLNFTEVSGDYMEAVYETYRSEIKCREENGGRVIIPEVLIKSRSETYVFADVEVFAHDLRSDIFQPGVITAIDTILSLGEAGLISYDLQWYESIGTAGVVKATGSNASMKIKAQGAAALFMKQAMNSFAFLETITTTSLQM